jgi:hypothetical protein
VRALCLRSALVAFIVVLLAVAYINFVAQDRYVLYRGERRPAVEAGEHVCHFLNLPEVRCFDSWDEVLADMKDRWPSRYDGLKILLEAAGPSPKLPVEP